ncbi:hypothetical protein [Anaerococcus sp.]|uniref:hypothetical protein n=1 Tax=Anaerococcus sp. TaxID=1872515 RepID=UPI002A75450F|nr:hypothetical protein [Anaerococcus sp.]MDY2928296.1 hypothetical protein [Anaerococcus sp.]
MISYKEAMGLLKSESPVYYKDQIKRKITGLIWRRDHNSLYSTVEVLDESRNCVSIVGLDDITTCEEEIESVDSSKALIKVNNLIEVLQNMKACLIYENVDKAKDLYNKLMREAIKLDEEIMAMSDKVDDQKVIEMIEKNKKDEEAGFPELDYETIEREDAELDKRIEEFDDEDFDCEEEEE